VFFNYLTIAFRNIFRYRLYAFINIFGLALGISFFTLLIIFTRLELSYDTIHNNHNRTFRITKAIEKSGIGERTASVPFPLGTTIYQYYPDYIESFVRIFNFQVPSHSIQYKKKQYNCNQW